MEPKSAKLIADLRSLADYLEAHPELDPWIVFGSFHVRHQHNRETLAAAAREHAPIEKKYHDDTFWLTKNFGDLQLSWMSPRNIVCRQVVTEKQITRPRFVPDGTEETVTVKETSWECTEPLLAS